MSDPTADPQPLHWLPAPEDSRSVISLILEGGFDAVRYVSQAPEIDGMDPIEMVLTCLAMEAVRNGCAVVELEAEVRDLKAALKGIGALTGGLFGAEQRAPAEDPDDERDPELEAITTAFFERGREMRERIFKT